MFNKAILLTNPNSRSGKSDTLTQCVERFRARGVDISVCETKSPEDARTRIAQVPESVRLIIVAGGDGTIHNVAQALADCGKPVAILPMGTANDLAKSLNLPADPVEACDAILDGELKTIDLGQVDEHLFFNAAHMGLGVKITHELTPELKKSWGVLGYLKAFLSVLKRRDSFRVKLTLDGRVIRLRAMHIGIGNGRYYGGGNVVDQNCFINDGKLSLFVLKPQSMWDLLTLAPLLRTGTQRLAKQTFTARANQISVSSKKNLEIHADGEPLTYTPAQFSVVPKALQMVCGKGVLESDQTTQSVVKLMEWLRSDQDVLLNDLLVSVQESADFFGDAAEMVEDKTMQKRLQHFKNLRETFVAKINRYLESQGELPVVPDPDAEWSSKILNHLKVKFATNTERALIQQRLSGEQQLMRLIQTAENMDFDENFSQILQQLEKNTRVFQDDLNTLLETDIAV